MRATLIKLTLAAASLGSVALASALDHDSSNVRIYRRQAFDPDETTASGSNCIEAFGPGYIECAPATATKNRLCIIPSEGETCCDNKWGCPAESFCLVQDLCCPDGLDPATCAVENGVELPDDFVPGGTSNPTSPAEPEPEPSSTGTAGDDEPTPSEPTPSPTKGSGSSPTGGSGGQTPPVQVGGAAARDGVSALIALAGLAVAVL